MVEQRKKSGISGALGCGAGILTGAVLAAVLAALLLSGYLGVSLLSFLRSPLGSMRTRIDVSQPTVVRQIQQLERLETVSYTMNKMVSGERSNEYLPKFLVGDRLMLVVHGEAVAGVDLRKLSSKDVVVTGRSVTVRLPKAELFSTRIDNERTQIYSRETGLFSSVDPDLETEVRRAAERQLREAALRDGILQTAEQNARATLTTLLKGFGFEQVDVR